MNITIHQVDGHFEAFDATGKFLQSGDSPEEIAQDLNIKITKSSIPGQFVPSEKASIERSA